jgi:hypothetical protein
MIQLMLEPDNTPQQDLHPEPEPNLQISLYVLMGHTIPQTLRVLGQINHTPLWY